MNNDIFPAYIILMTNEAKYIVSNPILLSITNNFDNWLCPNIHCISSIVLGFFSRVLVFPDNPRNLVILIIYQILDYIAIKMFAAVSMVTF